MSLGREGQAAPQTPPRLVRRIKVLVVESVPRVRQKLAADLDQDPGLHVVGSAPDPYVARDRIVALHPQVITLDLDLPRMDGVKFLRRLLPQHPIPVVIVSAQGGNGRRRTLEALEAGAVDFVPKAETAQSEDWAAMLMELRTKIKIASTANLGRWQKPTVRLTAPAGTSLTAASLPGAPAPLASSTLRAAGQASDWAHAWDNEQAGARASERAIKRGGDRVSERTGAWDSRRTSERAASKGTGARTSEGTGENYTEKVIAIGASTGGTEALARIAPAFPPHGPGIVVVQHMPAGFTHIFAERLNNICPYEVKEAKTGDRVLPGRMLIAPGEKHMRVIRQGGHLEVECRSGARVSGHCPSVDVLMHSVAAQVGRQAVGIMLTGMGRDGAAGMLAMRTAGARNLAQDESSSVVYGMPREVMLNGAAERAVPLERIPEAMLALLAGAGR